MSLLNSIRPTAVTETILYTVGPASKAIVNIFATNVNGTTSAKIRIGVRDTAGSLAAKDYFVYDLILNNNEYYERTGIALSANQVIRVYTDVASVNFHCHGLVEGA